VIGKNELPNFIINLKLVHSEVIFQFFQEITPTNFPHSNHIANGYLSKNMLLTKFALT